MEDKLIAYVVLHKRTGKILKQAGISFTASQVAVNPIYKDEYEMIEIEIKNPKQK